MYRMGDILEVAKISNIFGVLEISDIFLGWTVDAGREPTMKKKIRVPLLGQACCQQIKILI